MFQVEQHPFEVLDSRFSPVLEYKVNKSSSQSPTLAWQFLDFKTLIHFLRSVIQNKGLFHSIHCRKMLVGSQAQYSEWFYLIVVGSQAWEIGVSVMRNKERKRTWIHGLDMHNKANTPSGLNRLGLVYFSIFVAYPYPWGTSLSTISCWFSSFSPSITLLCSNLFLLFFPKNGLVLLVILIL